MVSFWEQQAEERRRRSLAAKAARYGGQAAALSAAGSAVGGVPVSRSSVRPVDADVAAQQRLASEFSTDLFPGSGSGRDQRVVPPTAVEQAQSRKALKEFVFGPERGSVVPGRDAGLRERVLRDWVLSEQEFRLAAERAREGRFGSAAGWAGLGLAGFVPAVGDAVQGASKIARAAVRRSADLSNNFANEVASGAVRYTANPDVLAAARPHRKNAIEIIHRQGFDGKPAVLPRNDFNRLASSSEYIPIFRGVSNTGSVPASRFVDEFANGEFFVGGGTYGAGAYFSRSAEGAVPYSALGSQGSVIEALVPKTARILDLDSPLGKSMFEEFRASPFVDAAEYFVSKGYDGLTVGNDFILYNRSAVVVPR